MEIVWRDRGGGYGEAAARARPEAVQLADRWPLIQNASSALLDGAQIGAGDSDGALCDDHRFRPC